MAQMAGLGALPYAMSDGGFAPAPQRTPMAGLGPVEQPMAPPSAPLPTFTMADRSNAIYALSRQGLSPDEIKAQLAAMGMIDPAGVITPEAEIEPVEEAGIGTLLRTGALNIGAMTGEGVGTIQQALGFEEAGQATKDAAAEAFALSPEDQQALALRAEGKGIIGQGVDAAIQSSPQMVGTLAAGVAGGKTGAAIGSLIAPGPGTAIGAAIGAVLGGTFVNLPTLIGSASQRAESLGQDVNDPAVRDDILAVGAANAIGESLINLIPGGKAASVGFKTAAQLAAQQATRKAVGRVATVGAKAALLEATTEAAQVLTEVIAFDDDLRAQMDEGEIAAMLPLIKERYGEELAVSMVAGGLMGGVTGVGSGAVQDKQYRGALAKEESDRAEAVATLKTAAERGGLAPDALDAAVNDPERSAIVKSGAQMLNAAKQEVMTAQQMRDGAIASGDPGMIDAANKRLQEALAQADAAYDAVIPKLGGLSSAQARAADADRANAARDTLVKAGVADPTTITSIPDGEVRGLERDFSLAQKKVEAAKQALNGPDMFETAKRQKAQAELDKAQLEFEKTQRRITIKTGLETEESIRQKAVAKQQADQREAVIQRQFDREFKPLIDAGRTDEAQAKAQAIIASVAGQPDKALENQIAKLEAKLQRATTPDEMDRLEAQIAARKARRGQEAPIVAAANRVLGSAGSQQAGVGVQGPSPAPAGQSAAPTATTGTATPAAPTVTPASVPPVTQGQPAAAGLVPPQPQQALAAGPTVVPPAAAPTSTAPITPAAPVGTAQNPIPTPENPLGYVPTGTPIQQVEAYSKAKLVAPPEVTLAAAPEILKRAEAARKAAGLNPDATRVELFAAGGGRQSSLEADLESALGLPYGASPSQLRAALQARQDAAPKPETVEPGAQPETKPDTDLAFPANLLDRDTLKTPDGTPVEVQYAVVSLDSLVPSNFDDGRINPAYPAVLQPRDRTTAGTQEQLQKIIAEFDPRFLGKTPTTNNGAPIIDTQGNVESGNGRAMMFERIHRDNPDLVAAYQKFLTDSGFNTDGIANPILVRIRRQPMTEAELLAYIRESNTPETQTMSSRETAMADAAAMSPETLALYRGGEVESAGNAAFVNRFIDQIVAGAERNKMRAKDGTLSQDGLRRIRNALFAKAYGDPDLLGAVAESTDSGIKTISSALMDAAPTWAKMRADVADGKIDPAVDKTDALMEAVRLVDRSRREGVPLPMLVNQTDMLQGDTISPEGRGFLDLMYRNVQEYKNPTGREKLTGALGEYVRLAGQTSPEPDLLGQKTSAGDILAATRNWLQNQYGGDTGQTQMALPVNPVPPPAPEPTPQPTPAQVQAQAQAEADADAAQKRADDKYLPKPAFDPAKVDARKRQGTDRDYRDLIDVLARNSVTLEEANAFVLAQAKRNGFENYVAWDADTGEVLGAGTSQDVNSVGFSQAVFDARNAGRRVALTHNHPNGTGFSGADIAFAATFGSNLTIHSVRPDGQTFTAKLTPQGARVFPRDMRKTEPVLSKIIRNAYAAARKSFVANGVASGNRKTGKTVSWDETQAILEDTTRAVANALASVNLIEYTDLVKGPTTKRRQNAMKDAERNARQAIRDAYSLSPPTRPEDFGGRLGAVQQPGAVRTGRSVLADSEAVDSGDAGVGRIRSAAPDDLRGRTDLDQPSDDLIVSETQSNERIQSAVDTFRQMMPGARQTIEVPDWLNVDPGGESALKSAMEAAKTPQRTLGRVGTFLETQLVNSLAPIRNLEMKVKGALGIGMDSAFKAAEIAVNDSGRNEQLMLYGAMKLGPNGEPRIAPGTIGLRQMLGKLRTKGMTDEQAGQSVVDWMAYMGARRAEEYKAKGLKPPLTDQDIADGLAKRSPLFDEVAADWKRFNDANVDFLVDTGRISKVLADKLKSDAAYIPFYRSDESMDGVPDLYDQAGIEKASNDLIRSGGSLLARNPRIQKLKGGGDKKVENLVNNMVRNSQAIVAAGMRNYAANKTFDILQNSGYAKVVNARQQNAKGDYVRVEKPENAIRIWRDGQESYLVPETADAMPVMLALASMEPVRLSGIARFMASVGSFFRQAITLNPGFMVRNHFRDTVSVAVLTGGKNLRINPLEGVGRGLDIMGKRTITRQSFTTLSGMGDYRFGGGDVGLGSNDFLMELGVEPKTAGYRFRQAIGALETVGTAFELANRLTYYETLIQQGVRADEAAYQALTLVNYNRRGASAMLRGLLPMVPFLNARIQGLARLYEDAVTNSPGKRLAAMTKLAINGSILSAFSAALWAWNNEDEERREKYEAEPLHRRLNYNIIYLPGDKTLLLPKAFEIGTVFGSSVEMLLEAAVQGDTDELGAATAMTLFNTFAFNPIPQAMVPALEILFNYNMFTGQPIEGRRMDDDLLTERINPQTSALAIALSQNGLGRMTGMSPIQFDHLMQGYGGLAYSFPATIIDVVAGNMGWIPSKPSGVFEAALPDATPGVVKGITTGLLKETFASVFKDQKDDGANRWVEEFYSRRIAIEQLYRTARDAAEDGDVARAKELLARAPASPAAYRLVSKAGDRLGEINTAMREIRQDPKMTADQKRAALQPLIAARNKMAGQVMQVIRDLEEKQGTSFRRAAY